MENIGNFFIMDETQRYKQNVSELKKAFPTIRDKSALRREFYCHRQSIFENASKFYIVNKLELKNKLGLGVTFEELVDIILFVLHETLQDYVEMRKPKSSDKLYEQLLKYEDRHGPDRGEIFSSPVHRGSHSKHFRNEEEGNDFRGGNKDFRYGNGSRREGRNYDNRNNRKVMLVNN